MQGILKKIHDYALEEIMGDRFSKYSKAIIQDRALPDVRDGLKPVQRRILYTMFRDHNTYDKPTRKSAKTVGNVMGTFHPHGDSSIYEAMVRMSQWWKQSATYIDMQGNNGSMDGDGAAAMRYTEARLSKISNELLKDIDKNTVNMTPNYDNTELEPTVLPVRFPNLLVNGANGISAGYATNIPPHNLGEIIEATIKRIDQPEASLTTILKIVKGPDFPTGGIIEGKKGIIDAYTTGRGRVIVKSKYSFEKNKTKEQIIITEIPFDVNKQNLVAKMNEIRLDKKIEGMTDIRDESDREGLRIAIDLKKDANKELIINYLLKNTELQISYNFNMVAIVNKRPMTLGILPILDAYIAHLKEVIIRRTTFNLERAKQEYHIVQGLIKALSILDDVIRTIRSSKNKSDAKANLVKEYDFTEAQAEAIVILQLYKLTNTDVTELQERCKNLENEITSLEHILNEEQALKTVMKEELKQIKKEYTTPRKTEIRDEITEIKIDTTQMIAKEDCIVVTTKDGYVKRVSLRSYKKEEETAVKEGDYELGIYEMNTLDTLLLFTDLGNYLYVPVHILPDLKWKELGKHINNIIQMKAEENIIACIPVHDFEKNEDITIFTKQGMIKRTLLNEFKVQRYSKPMACIKLKENDKVVDITNQNGNSILIATNNGYALHFKKEEVSLIGLKASGVKAISLKEDFVVSGSICDTTQEYVTIITDKGTGKRIRINEFELLSRARKGILLVRDVKTNPYHIVKVWVTNSKQTIGIKLEEEIQYVKITDLPIVDRYSTGTILVKKPILNTFLVANKTKLEEKEPETIETPEIEEISLEDIDQRFVTIDDLLNDFSIDDTNEK